MNNQDDRLGSLLIFSDIALILSTYGSILLFNYIFEPVNTNVWIVCTFFVGIKILIVGISDITGVGRNFFISALFVLIADGIIILINQLMAFGLSLRLMLLMVVVDLVMVLLAIILWKQIGRENRIEAGDEDWIYDEEPQTSLKESPVTTAKEEPQVIPVMNEGIIINDPEVSQEENIFDFKSLKDEPDTILNEKSEKLESIFSNQEDVLEAQDYLKFDELTEELPDNDEIEQALKESQTESKTDNDYFSGLNIFETKNEPLTEEPAFTTAYQSQEPEENTVAESEKEGDDFLSRIFTSEEGEKTEETPQEQEKESIFTSIEDAPVFESIEEEPELSEDDLLINLIDNEPEENKSVEEVEETTQEEARVEEEVIQTPEPVLENEAVEETPEVGEESYFISSISDFSNETGSTIGFLNHFTPIPVNVSQEQIDNFRHEIKDETIRLNNNLGTLANNYNNSLSTNDIDRIRNFNIITEDNSLIEADQLLRDNIQKLMDKEFIADNVIHSILELTNKLNNRSYSIDFAEENLKERLIREQRREEERKLREQQEELERQRRAQEKEHQERERKEKERKERLEAERLERERQEKERQEKEEQERRQRETRLREEQKQKETILNDHEVRLQNEDMDIIIDAADLELLKEFLAQQETNN